MPQFIGAASGTNSAGLPAGWQPGDLAVTFAYRDGNNTAPTLATGFTNIANGGANTNSSRSGWRTLASGDTTFTWSNATTVICLVYRPDPGEALAIAGGTRGGGAVASVTYPARTFSVANGTSWAIRFAGHRSTNTTLETPPAGYTLRNNTQDATDEASGFDRAGITTSPTADAVAVGGTASGWEAHTIEMTVALVTYTLEGDGSDAGAESTDGAVVQSHLLAGAGCDAPNSSSAGAVDATSAVPPVILRGTLGEIPIEWDGDPLEWDGQPLFLQVQVPDDQPADCTDGAVVVGGGAHVLEGSGTDQLAESAAGGIAQTHALAGDGSEQPADATAGSIAQGHVLAGDGSDSPAEASAGAVAQVHALVGTGSDQPADSTAAAAAQSHLLAGAGCDQPCDSTAGAVSVGAVHVLAGDGCDQANESPAAGIVQAHLLTGAGSDAAGDTTDGSIIQAHLLAGSGSDQPTDSTSGAIDQTAQIILAGPGCDGPAESAAGAVAQWHVLEGAWADGPAESTAGSVIQGHLLGGVGCDGPAESMAGSTLSSAPAGAGFSRVSMGRRPPGTSAGRRPSMTNTRRW